MVAGCEESGCKVTTIRSEEDDAPPLRPRRRRGRRHHTVTAATSLWHHIAVALSIAALLLVIGIATAAIIVPKATGSTALTVLTGSMRPSYPPGTLVVIRPTPVADIQVGDVITYQITSGQPAVATHRVIEKGFRQDGEVQFITQGDNNSAPDQNPVREVQVRGRLWYAIPYLGWVNSAMNGGQRQALVPILGGLLLAYAAWMLVSGVRDKRRTSKSAEAPPTPDASD